MKAMLPLLLLTLMAVGTSLMSAEAATPNINGTKVVEDLLSTPPKRFLLTAGVLPLHPDPHFLVIVSGHTDLGRPRKLAKAVLFNQSVAEMNNASSTTNTTSILNTLGVLLDELYSQLVMWKIYYTQEPMSMLCLEFPPKSSTSCLLFIMMSWESKMVAFDLLQPEKPGLICEVQKGGGWDRVAGGLLPLASDAPNEYFSYEAAVDDDGEELSKFNSSISLTRMVNISSTSNHEDLCLASSSSGHQVTLYRNLCQPGKDDRAENGDNSVTTTTESPAKKKKNRFTFEEDRCSGYSIRKPTVPSNRSLFGFDALTGFVNGPSLYLLLLDGRVLSLPKAGFILTGEQQEMTVLEPGNFWYGWKPAPKAVPMPPPRPPTSPTPPPSPVTNPGNSTGNGTENSSTLSDQTTRKAATSTSSDRLPLFIGAGVLLLLLLVALAALIWYCVAAKTKKSSDEDEQQKKRKKSKEKRKKDRKERKKGGDKKKGGEGASSSKPPSKVGGGSSAASSSSSSSAAAPAGSSSSPAQPKTAPQSKVRLSSAAKLSPKQKVASSAGLGVARSAAARGSNSSVAASSVSSAFASRASKAGGAPRLIKGGGGGNQAGKQASSSMTSSRSSSSNAAAPAGSKINKK